jgi:exodeoxyribonuclease VII small subunit
MEEPKFEVALSRLEEVVKKLENGNLPLDESLRLFEEGIGLIQYCSRKLDEAEKKVEILIKNNEGKKEIRPFTPEEFMGNIQKNDTPNQGGQKNLF